MQSKVLNLQHLPSKLKIFPHKFSFTFNRMRVKYNCGQTKLLFPIKRYHLLPVDEDESTSKAFTIPRRVLIT